MADSLSCQRCHQSLILDSTITSLTPSQYALIAGTLPTPAPASVSTTTASRLDALPPASRPAAAVWAAANPSPAESFVLLTDSVIPSASGSRSTRQHAVRQSSSGSSSPGTSRPGTPSSPTIAYNHAPPHPALAAKLHALLSSRTPVDHPLCTECTALLQSELQKEVEELTRERDAYIAFEQGFKRRVAKQAASRGEDGDLPELVGEQDEWDALVARKRALEDEERALRATLKAREDELAAVKAEEQAVKFEEAAVDKEEEEFLMGHAALSTQLTHLSHTLASAKTQLLLSTSLLAHLESTNVYNDAFQIGNVPLYPDSAAAGGGVGGSSSGKAGITVGTINGLRLGGRPVVDWDEINAAWGLVALCIDRLAVKVGCNFVGYNIIPLGSFSRIEEVPSSKGSYELYASSDISPARILQNRRFNYALVALLDCLRQLVEYGRKAGRAWGAGGIEISKDKINGHPIRLPGLTSGIPTLGSMSIMGLGSGSSSVGDNEASGGRGGQENSKDPDEQWTRACRAVLIVLKRILVVESEADRGSI